MKIRSTRLGFTLIELMVVTLFLSIIGVYTWGYMRSTITTQRKIEQKLDIQQSGISIVTKLQDDINQVFFVESNQKLTFFKGHAHDIFFSSLSHDAPSPQDRESDQADIFYTLEDDKEGDGKTKLLMRKEIPYLSPEADKDSDYLPVSVGKHILSMDFTYSDDGIKYVDEWDTGGADHPNKLPKLVRIQLVVRDDGEHEELFEALVDLPMTDDLNIQAATPGTPAAPGTPGTPATPGKTTTPQTKTSTPTSGGPGGIKK